MSQLLSETPHSAHVEAWLVYDQNKIAVGSVGPEKIELRSGADIPPGIYATLKIVVDHVPSSWQVCLPNGAVPFDLTVEYQLIRDLV